MRGEEEEGEVDMSAGTSVIVAVIFALVLIGIQFLVAWRFPADDEGQGSPDDIAVFFRPFGHIGWGGSASSYGSWGPGHWPRRPHDRDAYP
jgi:hypothetical protein